MLAYISLQQSKYLDASSIFLLTFLAASVVYSILGAMYIVSDISLVFVFVAMGVVLFYP
ncbi:hypothetical protein HRbin01_01421 [archaeon HR01]|nr:hypothetical protein HRbin01_01421 [archaeon HR01]